MSSEGAAKATVSVGDVAEASETMVEIKIKTLDSQTYSLRVDKFMPVPLLKEQIATVTGVLSEQQRLICRGKVLKDDQLLSEYHVEDGHTLHLVVRQPHQSASTSYMGSEGSLGHPDTGSTPGNAHTRGSSVAHSFVFESINLDQGDMDTSVISRIVSSMLESIGATGSITGSTENDIREMISERLTRASSDSGILDSRQRHTTPVNLQRSSNRRQGDFVFPSSIPSLPLIPPVIPDSLTTLNQYVGFMREEFSRQGFGSDANEQIDEAEATGLHPSEGVSHESLSHAAQGGLPTLASLAEILLSTRQLLMEQTGECLYQLARQLEGHSHIMDPLARMNMQSGAIRSGVVMRNLGSLLLELGRTTMTVRMGQTPAEAIVNAGPANFISANGPNPLMVQPVPFYPGPAVTGMHMGLANSGNGREGQQLDPAFVPRNVEIRIRTLGRAIPVATTSATELAAAQQEQTDPTRNSLGANVVHQALAGREPGVRVVPLRTVVAVPLLARVRPQTTRSGGDARGSQASTQLPDGAFEADQQPLHQMDRQREILESNSGDAVRDDNHVPASTRPFGSGLNPSNESAAYQGISHVFSSGQIPSNNDSNRTNQANDDTTRCSGSHEAARSDMEQGVFFSNVLRQIMPLITEGRESGVLTTNPTSSTSQTEGGNLDGASSSQHLRDPPESPSPKRLKKQ